MVVRCAMKQATVSLVTTIITWIMGHAWIVEIPWLDVNSVHWMELALNAGLDTLTIQVVANSAKVDSHHVISVHQQLVIHAKKDFILMAPIVYFALPISLDVPSVLTHLHALLVIQTIS